MSTKPEPIEIWKTTSTKGAERYWRLCIARAVPMKRTVAESGLASGFYALTSKPEFVGR